MSVVSPSREDPVARAASAVVGGPAGAHVGAGRHGWWTASRVLVVLAMVVLALGVVAKQHCRADGWTSPDEYTHACYSDLPTTFATTGIAQGVTPYLDAQDGRYFAEPVGTGALYAAVAATVPLGLPAARVLDFFDRGTVVIALALALLVVATTALAGRRPWDAAAVALSPLVVLSALISFDLVAIALGLAGLWAFSRRRPWLAGILIGAGASVRWYPALIAVALLLVALRAGRFAAAARTCAGAAGAWLVVQLPVLIANPDAWLGIPRGWSGAGPGYGSVWSLPGLAAAMPRPGAGHALVWRLPDFARHAIPAGAASALAVLGLVAVIIVTGVWVLAAARRPRLPVVALVLTAGVLLTAKAVSPQASLALVPLAALAVPRWRVQLVWLATECAYWLTLWLYLASFGAPDRSLPGEIFGLFLILRLAGIAYLLVAAVRVGRRPDTDPVRAAPAGWTRGWTAGRAPAVDDPTAGELDGAADALVIRFG